MSRQRGRQIPVWLLVGIWTAYGALAGSLAAIALNLPG
jgi:hypothetical protein